MQQAFEQLYRSHAPEVYRYALGLLGNPVDAEDVAQTTFLNAYRAFQGGQRPLHARNWLIAIAHNVCRMRWRAAGHRPREVALEEAPEPAAPDHAQQDLDAVLHALGRLSFNQRAALVMRELEGRSYREIGELLGISTSAVEALLFRARRRLRLERGALGALATVPMPAKLSSVVGFCSAGTAGATAGGSALGADLLLKAATVIAVGAVTVGTAAKPLAAHHGARHAVPATAASAAPAPVRTAAPGPAKAGHRRSVAAQPVKTRMPARARTAKGETTEAAGSTGGLVGPAAPPAPAPAAAVPPAVQLPNLPAEPPSVPEVELPVPPVPALPPPPVLPPPPLP